MNDQILEDFEKYLEDTYYNIEGDLYYNEDFVFEVDWEHADWDGESFVNYKAVKRFKYELFGLEFETELTTDLSELVTDLCNTIADEYPSSNNWNVEDVAVFNLQKMLKINTEKANEILKKNMVYSDEK